MTFHHRNIPGPDRLFIIFFVALSTTFMFTAREGRAFDGPYASLQTTLMNDGFDPSQITRVYAQTPGPVHGTVAATFRLQESKLNYAQFLEAGAIAKARKFSTANRTILDEAERAHGVDQSVIVAILLVETGCGNYTGRNAIFPILSTFALMTDAGQRDKVWTLLSSEDRARWTREAFDQKLLRRAEWAYGEVCALIRIGTEYDTDPTSYRGSIMGAIGWPQFLPSSLVRYGVDGDGDGRVDLYEAEDAIFSVANYLKGYGWKEGLSYEEKSKVIWGYNHSQPYVDTVLAIADRL